MIGQLSEITLANAIDSGVPQLFLATIRTKIKHTAHTSLNKFCKYCII